MCCVAPHHTYQGSLDHKDSQKLDIGLHTLNWRVAAWGNAHIDGPLLRSIASRQKTSAVALSSPTFCL